MLTRFLWQHLRSHRRPLLAVIALQAAQTIATLQLPRINARIIDEGIIGGDRNLIWTQGAVMTVLALVQLITAIGAVYVGAKIAMGFGRDLRDQLYAHTLGLPTDAIWRLGQASLITRVTNDVQQLQIFVLMICTALVAAPISAVTGLVMALREDVTLSVVLFVAIPILLGIVMVMVRLMRPHFAVMQDRIDGVNRVLREQIMGLRVIRAFVRESDEQQRFHQVNTDLTQTALASGRIFAFMFPSVLLVLNLANVAVLQFGSGRVETNDLALGSLVAFLTYTTIILQSVMFATFITALAPRAAVCAERIIEVFDEPLDDRTGSLGGGPITSLELDRTSFGYPGASVPVLKSVSLRIEQGQRIAIVGGTGAGKTTLLNILSRQLEPTGGVFLINGQPSTELAPQAVWNELGLVPQRALLFSGTVRSNLTFADPDASEAAMWDSLEIAQAADFVRAMPEGLDARIAQGGSNLSGGQRQRLTIARALVRPRSVYLFDDSFSALDATTEARLRHALNESIDDAIVITVAQRISTARDADAIVVLDHGTVVGVGRHDELIETCPTYAEIVASQTDQAPA